MKKTLVVGAAALAAGLLRADAAVPQGAMPAPAEIGIGWKDGWVEEWKRDVPGLEE